MRFPYLGRSWLRWRRRRSSGANPRCQGCRFPITLIRVTKPEFLLRLDEMLELEPGTLKGTELLTELPRWDSLAVIGYIALLDECFGVNVPAAKINACRSLPELLALIGPEFR